jgi:hypothetical protein
VDGEVFIFNGLRNGVHTAIRPIIRVHFRPFLPVSTPYVAGQHESAVTALR